MGEWRYDFKHFYQMCWFKQVKLVTCCGCPVQIKAERPTTLFAMFQGCIHLDINSEFVLQIRLPQLPFISIPVHHSSDIVSYDGFRVRYWKLLYVNSPHIGSLDTRWRWVASFMLQPLCPFRGESQMPVVGPGVLKGRSGRRWKDSDVGPASRIDLWFFGRATRSLVAVQRYSDTQGAFVWERFPQRRQFQYANGCWVACAVRCGSSCYLGWWVNCA
jgi:hypothetical protein